MPALTSPVALPFALVAGSLVLTVAACGSDAGSSSTPTSSAAATASATAATGTSGPATPATSTSPTTSTSASAGSSGTGCTVGSLKITYADDAGGAGAGSVVGALTFTNTGSAACTLAGFPGVSYVGGGNGTQVGQAATRTDDAVKTKTLAPGARVEAALRRTQPRNYGDVCRQAEVDGFRVFPPGSTASAFVAFPTTGCKSPEAPLLQVSPVR